MKTVLGLLVAGSICVGSGGVAGGRAGYRCGARGGGPRGRRRGFHVTGGSPVRGAGAAGEHAEDRRPARPPGPPARETWYAEPVKVFDNLYFVGQTEYSAWAVTTSDGIIIIDPIFDYSVEDEVVNGLKKLGLDPSNDQVRPRQPRALRSRRRRVVPAGSLQRARDHVGGRLDVARRARGIVAQAEADLVATDGQKLTLGDTTLTLHITPGHTLGTISTLIPVRDGGTPHMAAYWGGTAFNWVANRAAYITPERSDSFWFRRYIESAQRFRELAAQGRRRRDPLQPHGVRRLEDQAAGDGDARRGDPHPYVVGADAVSRYLTVAEECAKAGRLRAR